MRTKWVARYWSAHGWKVRKRKNVPAKCGAPKRVCIACKASIIRKNDKCYESKVCRACTDAI